MWLEFALFGRIIAAESAIPIPLSGGAGYYPGQLRGAFGEPTEDREGQARLYNGQGWACPDIPVYALMPAGDDTGIHPPPPVLCPQLG